MNHFLIAFLFAQQQGMWAMVMEGIYFAGI